MRYKTLEQNTTNEKILTEALHFLAEGHPDGDLPTLVLKLKKRFPLHAPELLNLAAEVFISRRSAPEKLGDWARNGFFSASVLQQASRSAIAAYRAQRFVGAKHVLEIGTGSGCDTAALARVAEHVSTIDLDPTTSDLAKRNLQILGVSNVTCLVGDAQQLAPSLLTTCDAIFADPARRTSSGQRVKAADDYSPPLDWVLDLPVAGVKAVKVSPGLFVEPRPNGCSRQFVGYGDECLEQTLWFNAPIHDSSVVLADSGTTWSPDPSALVLPDANELGGYLCEAHGAVNRSKFLRHFFSERQIQLIADDVAYGVTSDLPAPTPLMKRFRVLGEMPFQAKQLKTKLSQLAWSNRTEFKKRSVTVDPEKLRAEMKLPEHSHGAPFGVVFLFPWRGKTWVVFGERLSE